VAEYGKGVALVSGEIGAGKSTLSRVLIFRLNEEKYDIGLVINPSIPAKELLYEIALQLGISSPKGQRSAIFRAINKHVFRNAQRGRSTVLIIDEAHTITQRASFEELRMLLNFQLGDRHFLSLFLLGQPDLNEAIAEQPPLDQRVAVRLHLGPLSVEETASYIECRLKKAGAKRQIFTDEAIKVIHREAEGLPRSINNHCDLCLLEGMKEQLKEVDASLVKSVMALV
jgi:general secretion pathway protein A